MKKNKTVPVFNIHLSDNRNMKTSSTHFLYRKAGLYATLTILLVAICYKYIDRSIVTYFHELNTRKYYWIDIVQQLPTLLLILSPLLIIAAFILKKKNKNPQLQHFFFSSFLGLVLSNILKLPLKFVFGRYWPETFKNNNPSFLHDGAYGFNLFHWGNDYGSFPSGHAITITAFATSMWIIYPRLRWVAVLISLSVMLALLVLYYHFLSDLLAGTYVGVVLSIFLNKFLIKNKTVQSSI